MGLSKQKEKFKRAELLIGGWDGRIHTLMLTVFAVFMLHFTKKQAWKENSLGIISDIYLNDHLQLFQRRKKILHIDPNSKQ